MLCVYSLAPSNALTISDALLPSWRGLEEPDVVHPSSHEGVSSNVKLKDCSILWDLGMYQAGLTVSWKNFSLTLSLWAFLALSLVLQNTAAIICIQLVFIQRNEKKKGLRMAYVLEISLRLLEAKLIYQVNRKCWSTVDQFTFMNPGPNSAVRIPFKSSLRKESQRLLDTPLYSYIMQPLTLHMEMCMHSYCTLGLWAQFIKETPT